MILRLMIDGEGRTWRPALQPENVVLRPHSASLTRQSAVCIAISTATNVLTGVHGGFGPAMVSETPGCPSYASSPEAYALQ
jgi:phosphoglycerate dehydrogenase-like enzyme